MRPHSSGRAAAVLTVSDSTHRGKRQDVSGPVVAKRLQALGFTVVEARVVPDETVAVHTAIVEMCARARLVITTGGTGIAPRDVTPEATRAVLDREIPGITEVMRMRGLEQSPLAPLSRAVCGSRGATLILNLPGNPDGAYASLNAVADLLPHALDLLAGDTKHSQG